MRKVAYSLLVVAAMLFGSAAARLQADIIKLDSGEILHGKITSVTDMEVRMDSKRLGPLSLPRSSVVAIVFGDAVKKDGTAEPKKNETPEEIIKRLAPKDFGPGKLRELERGSRRQNDIDAVIDQLRREGVPPGLMDELHLRMPGFGAPKVQSYFHDKVNGLITGRISIQDIRKDAIKAREGIIDLQKDLGPGAAALDGYLGILDGFIQKTAPAADPKKGEPSTDENAAPPMISEIGPRTGKRSPKPMSTDPSRPSRKPKP